MGNPSLDTHADIISGQVPRIAQIMLSLRAVVVRASVIQMVIWVLITGPGISSIV